MTGGRTTPPSELTIKWHRPSHPEIFFAVELFQSQAQAATERVEKLMSEDSGVSRTGKE